MNAIGMLRNLWQMLDNVAVATPFPKMRLPRALQFPINDICNSRCQMCLIWEKKKDHEITPEEIRRVLRNPLFRKVMYVGINGGEPTLRKDIAQVAAAVVETLPALRGISLITNAILHSQVQAAIEGIGRACHAGNVRLDVMVSLDGIGEIHDRVRGRSGNFASAVRVLDYAQSSSFVDATRIGCTVIKDNVYDVENVLDWCQRRNLYARFRLGIPHRRLYSLDVTDPFNFGPDEKYHFANFLDWLHDHYEKNLGRKEFYRSLRNQIAYGAPRTAGCLWRHSGVTLSSRGELSYCAVASDTLGDAITEDPSGLYWGQAEHLQHIHRTACAGCHHDYEGLANRKVAVREAALQLWKPLPKAVKAPVKAVGRSCLAWKEKSRLRQLLDYSKRVSHATTREDLPRRLLVIGWYGTETLGDKGILAGLAHTVRSVGDWKIDVSSLEPYITEYTKRQMPELGIDRVVGIDEACRNLKAGEYGAVMFGGGPLMGSVPDCRTMLRIFCIAKECGAKTIVAGCGIGPLGWPAVDPAIGELLRLADAVVLRDSASRELARKAFGFTGEVSVALDPAFLWASRALSAPVERDPNQILLALREWPIYDYGAKMGEAAEPTRRRFEDELRRMVQAILTANPSAKIVPFCMHKNAVGGDDRAFYRRLFADFPAVLQHLDNRHRAPIDDLAVIARSHAMLAMRFHSLVLGLATNTPLLAIDYTLGGKIAGLLKDLDAESLMLSLADFDGCATAARLMAAPSPPSVDGRIAEAGRTLESVIRRWLTPAWANAPGNATCG